MRLHPGNPIVADSLAVLTPTGEGAWQNENPKEGITTLQNLMQSSNGKAGIPPDPGRLDSYEVYDYLSRSEAAAGITWSAWIPSLHKVNSNLHFTTLPGGALLIGSWLLACAKDCDEYARQFIAYSAPKGEPCVTINRQKEWIASRKDYVHIPEDALAKARPRPRTTEWTSKEKELSDRFAEVLLAPDATNAVEGLAQALCGISDPKPKQCAGAASAR
jgi:hypothetical protein